MNVGEKFSDPLKLLGECEKLNKGIVLTGLLKESEVKNHISFSPSHGCHDWFDLPTKIIEETEYIGLHLCMVPDEPVHHHPVVKIRLNEIEGPLGKMLASLLNDMQTIAYKPHPDAPYDPPPQRTSSDPFRRPNKPDNPFTIQDEACNKIGNCGAWGVHNGQWYLCGPDQYPCQEPDGTIRCITSPSCYRFYRP